MKLVPQGNNAMRNIFIFIFFCVGPGDRTPSCLPQIGLVIDKLVMYSHYKRRLIKISFSYLYSAQFI